MYILSQWLNLGKKSLLILATVAWNGRFEASVTMQNSEVETTAFAFREKRAKFSHVTSPVFKE